MLVTDDISVTADFATDRAQDGIATSGTRSVTSFMMRAARSW